MHTGYYLFTVSAFGEDEVITGDENIEDHKVEKE